MSIATQIAGLNTAKANIAAEIADKGVDVQMARCWPNFLT